MNVRMISKEECFHRSTFKIKTFTCELLVQSHNSSFRLERVVAWIVHDGDVTAARDETRHRVVLELLRNDVDWLNAGHVRN